MYSGYNAQSVPNSKKGILDFVTRITHNQIYSMWKATINN